jgi:hypothetical protein
MKNFSIFRSKNVLAALIFAKIGAHVDGSIWLFFFNGINSGQGFPIECFEYVPLPKENEI